MHTTTETEYPIGTLIRTRVADCDADEDDNERAIPIGTLGTISEHHGSADDRLHTILWENGAATAWTVPELRQGADVVTANPNRLPLAPDIALSTGRVVTHRYLTNGAQEARIVGDEASGMTARELEEYCARLAIVRGSV